MGKRVAKVSITKLIIIIFLSILVYFIPLQIDHEAKVVFSVLVLAALLWTTATIPLFLTSLVITILLVLFKIFTFNEAVIKFANPILVLFFGGFLIARAMEEINLHKRIALQISSKVRNDKYELLVLMLITAFLSMWISNTATAVLMIPIALGIVHKFKKKMPNFTKAVILGIAYSANIGGIGTLIGSVPNAITTVKLMEITQINVGFLDWMKAALPLVIILVPLAWLLLIRIFPFEDAYLKKMPKVKRLTKKQKLFWYVFLVTILLWFTTDIHGLSSPLIALMSATFLFLIRLLKVRDLTKINYRILILFGGGLVLGGAMFSSGLSGYFANTLAGFIGGSHVLVVTIGVILLSIGVSSFASNTATAAILIPVILPLADVLNFSPKTLALLAGISASLVYLLPVGTPPNAIAYATGKISIKDMFKAGVLLTIISVVVLVLVANFLW